MGRQVTLLISILAILAFLSLSDQAFSKKKKAVSRSIKGKIIFVSEGVVELKWGRNEAAFIITEGTKFYNSKWAAADRNIMEICQVARAYYSVKGGKKYLQKIIILSGSYCR